MTATTVNAGNTGRRNESALRALTGLVAALGTSSAELFDLCLERGLAPWGYMPHRTVQGAPLEGQDGREDRWLSELGDGGWAGGPQGSLNLKRPVNGTGGTGMLHFTCVCLPEERLLRVYGWRRVILAPGEGHVGGEEGRVYSLRYGPDAPIGSTVPGAIGPTHRITHEGLLRMTASMLEFVRHAKEAIDSPARRGQRVLLPRVYAGIRGEPDFRGAAIGVVGSRVFRGMTNRQPACCLALTGGQIVQIHRTAPTGEPDLNCVQEVVYADGTKQPVPRLCTIRAGLEGASVDAGMPIATPCESVRDAQTWHELVSRVGHDLADELIQVEVGAQTLPLRLQGQPPKPEWAVPAGLSDLLDPAQIMGYFEHVTPEDLEPQIFLRNECRFSGDGYDFFDARALGQRRDRRRRR